MKTITVRVDDQDAAILEMIAHVDGQSISDEVRNAIGWLITQRRRNPEFMAKLRRSAEETNQLLEKFEEES